MRPLSDILQEASQGDRPAAQELAAQLYEELRKIARLEMARERSDHTLQPTALVHEAYLRLVGSEGTSFESKAHFLGAAARTIRRILVEHARSKDRLKRGAGRQRVDLESIQVEQHVPPGDLVRLDEALEELAALDKVKARLVELRFFAGMTQEEAARALGVSTSKVVRDWRTARAWLQDRLERSRQTLDEGSHDGS